MQAEDTWLNQSPNPGMCPLCSMPLTNNGTSQSQRKMVTCLSCGFSAPFVQRRHKEDSAPVEKAPTAFYQRSPAGSSVWIDPAVSAFLGGKIVDEGSPAPQTGFAYPQQSPLAAEPKKKRATPITPIPPTDPAPQHKNSVKVRPKYRRSHQDSIQDSDIDRIPTSPPPIMWQYESPEFEAESSLSALSLVVDTPTRPETTPSPKSTRRLPHIDEIDTVPPTKTQNQVDIDEIDTLPPHIRELSKGSIASTSQLTSPPGKIPTSLLPLPAGRVPAPVSSLPVPTNGTKIADPSSWTAGGATRSVYAQRIAERSRNKKRKRNYSFNLLDHLRWWLLHPGRIEFILWLGGTILLLCVTFALLLVSAVSFSWVTPILQNGHGTGALLHSSGSGSTSTSSSTTTVTTSGITLTLLSPEPLVPGRPILLHGQGCTPRGTVIFTDEKNWLMPDLDSQSGTIEADKSGAFTARLDDSSWNAGHHLIVVRDGASGRTAKLPVVLAVALFGKKGVTPTAVTSQPGLTATPTFINGSGGGPTPVSSTPVSTPTAVITPKPTPTQPKPSPTPVRVTPTPTAATTATVGTTPTPTTSSASTTATVGTTPTPTTSPATGNVDARFMSANVEDSSFNPHTNLDAWLWLLIAGYAVSMVMLGIAGILKRRKQ